MHAIVEVADLVVRFLLLLVNKLFSNENMVVCAGCRTAYQPR